MGNYDPIIAIITCIYLRNGRAIINDFKSIEKNATLLASIKEMINNGNLSNARSLCKSVNTPEAIMLEQGISRIGQSMQEIREAMDKAGSAELSSLEKT